MKVKDFITVLQNYTNNDAEVTINGERSIVFSYDENTVNIVGKEVILPFKDSADEGDGENL